MDLKTMLIVGTVCVLFSCKLSAEEADVDKFSDNYFEYIIGEKGTNALKCINKAATLGDLYRFVNTKCWNNHLKWKLSGRKLTREDADALDFCIDVHLEMLDALGESMLRELFGPRDFPVYIEVVPHTNQLNSVLAVGEMDSLRTRFIEGKESVGEAIHRWAEVYGNCPLEVASVLHNVFSASGDVKQSKLWFDNGQCTGWRLKSGEGLVFKLLERLEVESDEEYLANCSPFLFDARIKKAIKEKGIHVGDRWRSLHIQVQIFVDETREICSRIGRMRRSGIADSDTKKFLNEATSKWEHRCEYATRKFDYLLYDFPCCMLSYRTLGQLVDCKGVFIDDEDEMRRFAADYTYALCGTELLKGIRTRYAASCYTEVIKFLKSELGWFTQGAFREFANETKLYNITLSTDENGKQDNILEKWESKGNQKAKDE